jgi:hypothetical protein
MPTGGFIALRHHVLSVPAHVGIELANVLMAEFFEFQFNQHMALENTMIENKVHEIMAIPDENTFLTCLKTEPMAQLQQKRLKFIQKLLFQMRLAHDFLWLEPQEGKAGRS